MYSDLIMFIRARSHCHLDIHIWIESKQDHFRFRYCLAYLFLSALSLSLSSSSSLTTLFFFLSIFHIVCDCFLFVVFVAVVRLCLSVNLFIITHGIYCFEKVHQLYGMWFSSDFHWLPFGDAGTNSLIFLFLSLVFFDFDLIGFC